VAAEHADAVWVTESQKYSLAELVALSGLPEAELRELVEYGALRPANPEAASWVFSGQCVLSVLCGSSSKLPRIRELEARLGQVYAQQPRKAR